MHLIVPQKQKRTVIVWSFALDPTGEADDAPPDLLVSWKGESPPALSVLIITLSAHKKMSPFNMLRMRI